jgi:pimeloyl-ACP methyl ester carboxylesterase
MSPLKEVNPMPARNEPAADIAPQEIRLDTPNGPLAAKRWGSVGGLPTIGLHGWLDNANTFDLLAPLLPQLRLVCLDLPGHGMSLHRPPGMRYHYTDYVDDVMAAVDMLAWDRFILLGHSMGAGVGCMTASAFPERIDKLILIEGLGAVTSDLDDPAGALNRSVQAMRLQPIKPPPSPRSFDVLVRARAAASHITRESAAILMQRAVDIEGNTFHWRSDQRLKAPNPQHFTNELMLAYLRAIQAPTLLITGDNGILHKRSYFTSRCNAITRLQIVNLPGGHHLHLENPAPVANTIAEFIG